MTWTYAGDPSANDRDEVRFLIGDTDTSDQLVTDEEIAYGVAEEGNNLLAAARVAKSIGSKFARKPDKKIGDLTISFKQKSESYLDLAKDLEVRGAISAGGIFGGGTSIDAKDVEREDEDRVEPRFHRGQFTEQPDNTDRSLRADI